MTSLGISRYLILLVTIAGIASILTGALAGQTGPYISIVFEHPSKDGWAVDIEASVLGEHFSCKGIVSANPYYRETRAVSASLIVVPVYYIVDSLCPRLAVLLATQGPKSSSPLRVAIHAPGGYLVYTAMDERGYGGNGSYVLPLGLFSSQYIFDGVVVASEANYTVRQAAGLIVVEPRGSGISYWEAVRAVSDVAGFLGDVLGPSNRSPVVLVIASENDHPYMLSGVGYSLGGVVYVKPGLGEDSLVHLLAHETVHGWIGKGRLKGDPSLVEGAAELLSLTALMYRDRVLYEKALAYEEESQWLNPYAVWLRLHAAVRKASLEACGADLYLEAVETLYRRGARDASLLDLLSTVKTLAARHGCLERLEEALGAELLGARETPLHMLLEAISETEYPGAEGPRSTVAANTSPTTREHLGIASYTKTMNSGYGSTSELSTTSNVRHVDEYASHVRERSRALNIASTGTKGPTLAWCWAMLSSALVAALLLLAYSVSRHGIPRP